MRKPKQVVKQEFASTGAEDGQNLLNKFGLGMSRFIGSGQLKKLISTKP